MNYEYLGPKHPGLVYCSISSYGQEAPYREVPGSEICAQALGGKLILRDNTPTAKRREIWKERFRGM
jgi:crotonobetainyl-CoA:carnitine CoA-transferase CaiB-like acyl-CoA transferase